MNGTWTDKANKVWDDTHTALQTIWDNVNKGQKKQIRKIPECAEILDRYEVTDE